MLIVLKNYHYCMIVRLEFWFCSSIQTQTKIHYFYMRSWWYDDIINEWSKVALIKNTQPLYLIQDSTITTAIDIRRDIVSVINIANIPLSHQHVRMHQPFWKKKLAKYFWKDKKTALVTRTSAVYRNVYI